MSASEHESSQKAALERLSSLEGDLGAIRREVDDFSHLATLGLLAATIAHELRNILTPVLSYAQIAHNRPDDQPARDRSIERTIVGVQAAAEIIESTLHFASASNRRESAGANVAAVLDQALACLARDPAKDGVTIERDVSHAIHARIKPLELQQVFMNLILNAIRAIRSHRSAPVGDGSVAASGSRRVGRIRIAARVEPRGNVRIEVTDNGPGLPQQLADRLFQPFVSGDASRAPGQSGTGLGLTICRRLVESAGGRIAVRSAPGAGATFELTLPAAEAALRKAG